LNHKDNDFDSIPITLAIRLRSASFLSPCSSSDLDENWNTICTSIKIAALLHITHDTKSNYLSTSSPSSTSLPSDLLLLYKAAKITRKRFLASRKTNNHNRTENLRLRYKINRGKFQYELKRHNDKKLLKSHHRIATSFASSPKKFFQTVNRILFPPSSVNQLSPNVIADHFEDLFKPREVKSPQSSSVANFISELDQSSPSITLPISSDELIASYDHITSNASGTGPDDIHPVFLLHSKKVLIPYLLALFNSCLSLYHFPSAGKIAKAIALLKKGGDSSCLDSYRLLQITSVIARMFEHILIGRMSSFFKLSPFQAGFRKFYSTTDNLVLLFNRLCLLLQKCPSSSFIPVTFIDFQKAFDRVWRDALLYKLASLNIPHYIIKILRSFLSDRFFYVISNFTCSSYRPSHVGVIQGAISSPAAFNQYLDGLSDLEAFSLILLLFFADDVCFLSSLYGTDGLLQVRSCVSQSDTFCVDWDMFVNVPKSSVLPVHRSKKTPILPDISSYSLIPSQNLSLKYAKIYKYLGIFLDSSLSLSSHFASLIQKCRFLSRSISNLLHISPTLSLAARLRSPIPLGSVLSLINAYLLSHMTYGLLILRLPTTIEAQLHDLLSAPLKKYLCLPLNTNSLAVLAEFGIVPLHLLREYRLIIYAKKLIHAPADHPVRILLLSSFKSPDHFSAPASLHSIQHEFISLIKSGKYISLPSRCRDKSATLIQLLSDTSIDTLRTSLASQALISFKHHTKTKIINLINNYSLQPYLKSDSLLVSRLRARLRFNKLNINHNLFLRKKSTTPLCSSCSFPQSANETREHILLHCPRYRSSRDECLSRLRSLPKFSTLHQLTIPLLLDAHGSSAPPSFFDITGSFILSIYKIRKF
jgi:hypothetical protein